MFAFPKITGMFLLGKRTATAQKYRDTKPYDLFIKSKGKYRKVADNVSKAQALDLGGYLTDKSLSAQFKIRQDKGKLKKLKYNIPNLYWESNKQKFRAYRKSKGAKKQLVNQYIEHRKYRIDSSGEKKGLLYGKIAKGLRQNNLNIFGTTYKKIKKKKVRRLF